MNEVFVLIGVIIGIAFVSCLFAIVVLFFLLAWNQWQLTKHTREQNYNEFTNRGK